MIILIKIIDGCIDILSTIRRIAQQKKLKDELFSVIDMLIADINKTWNRFKKEKFFISEEDKRKFQWFLQDYQNILNELLEKNGVVKVCSKCHQAISSTTHYFYRDRSAKDGLRPECKQCHQISKRKQ